MSVTLLYHHFRERFPSLTKQVDIEHIRHWDEVDPAFAHAWFESLANTINLSMHREKDPKDFIEIFEFLRHYYLMDNDDVKNCIDVAFVENLFWRVSASKAQAYWELLPQLFRDLYLTFHQRNPVD